MFGKILSLVFALAAMVGAVLYAQKQGRENPRPTPVFETSKSGTPTPKDLERKEDKQEKEPAATQKPSPAQHDTKNEEKPRKKKVMPTSKSYIPD